MYQIKIRHVNGTIEERTAESKADALASVAHLKGVKNCIVSITPNITPRNKTPHQLIFIYDNGEQEDVGEYYSLKDAIKAKEDAKDCIGKADLLGRVLSAVSIIKKDCL